MTKEATSTTNPGYLDLLGSGALKDRLQLACQHLEQCDLCARYCRVNRLKTTEGATQTESPPDMRHAGSECRICQ